MQDAERVKRLKLYFGLTIVLLVIAFLSFLIVPRGSSARSCNSLILTSSRYDCLTALALSQENASVCAYESGAYADSCYIQVAEKSGNSGTCNSIQNASVLGLCVSTLAVANNDSSACRLAGEPLASSCEEKIALRLNNQSICSSISNSSLSIACGSIINTRLALLARNAGYCTNVTDLTDKNITGMIIQNLTAGSEMGGNAQYKALESTIYLLPNVTYTARDYCYTALAAQLTNSALCANVSAGEATNVCELQSGAYANTTENFTSALAACSYAGTFSKQCVQSVTLAEAVRTRNVTLCSQLQNGLDASCFSLLASTYMNATYCSYISNATAESSCVSGS